MVKGMVEQLCNQRYWLDTIETNDQSRVCFASEKCLTLQPKVPKPLASMKVTPEFVP